MTSVVQTCLDDVRSLCAKHHVRRLHLFGSGAGEAFDLDQSDLDFAVEFDSSMTFGPSSAEKWTW